MITTPGHLFTNKHFYKFFFKYLLVGICSLVLLLGGQQGLFGDFSQGNPQEVKADIQTGGGGSVTGSELTAGEGVSVSFSTSDGYNWTETIDNSGDSQFDGGPLAVQFRAFQCNDNNLGSCDDNTPGFKQLLDDRMNDTINVPTRGNVQINQFALQQRGDCGTIQVDYGLSDNRGILGSGLYHFNNGCAVNPPPGNPPPGNPPPGNPPPTCTPVNAAPSISIDGQGSNVTVPSTQLSFHATWNQQSGVQYNFFLKDTRPGGNQIEQDNVSGTPPGYPFAVTDPGVTYGVRVDAVGCTTVSGWAQVTVQGPPAPPPPPPAANPTCSSLAVSPSNSVQVGQSITLYPNIANAANLGSITFMYNNNVGTSVNGDGWTNIQTVNSLQTAPYTIPSTGLGDHVLTMKITNKNGDVTDYWNNNACNTVVNVTQPAGPPPATCQQPVGTLTITPPNNGQPFPAGTTNTTINWSPAPNAVSYIVSIQGGGNDGHNIPVSGTSYPMTLQNGTNYAVYVTGVGNSGCPNGLAATASFSVGTGTPPPPAGTPSCQSLTANLGAFNDVSYNVSLTPNINNPQSAGNIVLRFNNNANINISDPTVNTQGWSNLPISPVNSGQTYSYQVSTTPGIHYFDIQILNNQGQTIDWGGVNPNCLASVNISGPTVGNPYCSLTANPSIAQVNAQVNFFAQYTANGSSRIPTQYHFDFGDGQSQDIYNSSFSNTADHPYSSQNVYTGRVTLYDSLGPITNCPTSVTVQGTTTGQPSCYMTANPNPVNIGSPVLLTANFLNGGNNNFFASDYFFTFGDGSTFDNGSNPSYSKTYNIANAAGYPVSARVSGSNFGAITCPAIPVVVGGTSGTDNISIAKTVIYSGTPYTTVPPTIHTYAPNDAVQYSILVTNNSTSPTVNPVEVIDTPIPPYITVTQSQINNGGILSGNTITWNLGQIPAGGTTLTFTGTVSGSVPTGNTLQQTNIANLYDNNVFVSNSSATITVNQTAQNGQPTLTIVKTPSTQTAASGATVPFTITVTNTGSTTESGIQVTDTLPTGFTYVSTTSGNQPTQSGQTLTWSGISLTAGQPWVVSFNTTAPTTSTPANPYINNATATVGGYSFGPAQASVTINPPAGAVLTSNPVQYYQTPTIVYATMPTTLPKTGLPLLAWVTGAFLPLGMKLRKFSKGLVAGQSANPNYLWEDREFKK